MTATKSERQKPAVTTTFAKSNLLRFDLKQGVQNSQSERNIQAYVETKSKMCTQLLPDSSIEASRRNLLTTLGQLKQ
jgi:hypothetical protein